MSSGVKPFIMEPAFKEIYISESSNSSEDQRNSDQGYCQSVTLSYWRLTDRPLTQMKKHKKEASLRKKTGSLFLNLLGLILPLDIGSLLYPLEIG